MPGAAPKLCWPSVQPSSAREHAWLAVDGETLHTGHASSGVGAGSESVEPPEATTATITAVSTRAEAPTMTPYAPGTESPSCVATFCKKLGWGSALSNSNRSACAPPGQGFACCSRTTAGKNRWGRRSLIMRTSAVVPTAASCAGYLGALVLLPRGGARPRASDCRTCSAPPCTPKRGATIKGADPPVGGGGVNDPTNPDKLAGPIVIMGTQTPQPHALVKQNGGVSAIASSYVTNGGAGLSDSFF